MKLFFVHDVQNMLSGIDGQTTHVRELYRNFGSMNDLLCFAPKFLEGKFENTERIVQVPFMNKKLFSHITYELVLFFFLAYYCISVRPDALYARQSGTSITSLIVSKIFQIPYFIEINSLMLEQMKLAKVSGWRLNIARMVEKLNSQQSLKIITVTNGLKEELIKSYNIPNERIIVVENGANVDLFTPLGKEVILKKLGLDPSARYIVWAGYLGAWQGIEYIIQSAPLILKDYPDIRFLIVGGGVMKNSLMAMTKELGLKDFFLFVGRVPYEQVPLYINAGEICIESITYNSPFKSGFSPLKIYEYMACGKPVVTSEFEGLDFIEKINAGMSIRPANPEEMANAIIEILNNKNLRERMGTNGRKFVIENHSWSSVAKKITKIIENAIPENA